MMVVALAILMAIVALVYRQMNGGDVARMGSNGTSSRTIAPPPLPSPVSEPRTAPDMLPDVARRINAGIAYSRRANVAARPFVLAASPLDTEQAVTCLASAVWYEAGDDHIGQQAVAQVVLNRLRHPAFPKSVCGVVFQGAERTTGCQFTFTCDGALARSPSAAALKRAREVAASALSGFVYKPVGTATHYHTDWVVPYWAHKLDKITMVHTHIFYRWDGWWGQLAAFSGRHQGSERIDPRIARLSKDPAIALLSATPPPVVATDSAEPGRAPLAIPGLRDAELHGSSVYLADPDRGVFALHLNADADPASYAATAQALCRGRGPCLVAGWIKPNMVPARLPIVPSNLQTTSFIFRRGAISDGNQMWWNCKLFPREDKSECRPGTEPIEG